MTLDQLRALCDRANKRQLDQLICGYSCNMGRSFTPMQLNTLVDLLAERFGPMATAIEKLLAVAEAAKSEAIRWNEEYCSRAECEVMTDAWAKLDAALAALEAAP